ncbi:MAG: shikimate dehydrogenase, partial [Nitrospirae bacterium]|nr:shikimate dehydrogenase [Nitrospirota bacterium]
AIIIANRTVKKAEIMVRFLKDSFSDTVFSYIPLERKFLKDIILKADILINATSAGLKGDGVLPISQRDLHKDLIVYDLVYNPQNTPLLKMARGAGVKRVVNGLEMLLYQGALSFEIWTGRRPPIKLMKSSILKACRL